MTEVTLILTTAKGQTELRVKKNIQRLDLCDRLLIAISDNLSELDFLRQLDCSHNQLTSLPTLPASLQILWCHNNQLTSLPTLPTSLQRLYCFNNRLVSLPSLPASLLELKCHYNRLASLPTLPASLVTLFCYDNRLVSLPISLLQCRHLKYLSDGDNPIEYIPPALRRFLDRQIIFSHKSVYSDTQNVHSSSIQGCIRQSIYNLIEAKPALSADQCLSSMLSDTALLTKTKELLVEYLNHPDTHSVLGITSVWSVISSHPDRDEIKKGLNEEMADSECKCFTGRMSRLINCLNGFDDRVVVTISKPEQINALISLLMNKYEGEELKSHFKTEMTERGYEADIPDWIVHL